MPPPTELGAHLIIPFFGTYLGFLKISLIPSAHVPYQALSEQTQNGFCIFFLSVPLKDSGVCCFAERVIWGW